MSGRHSRLPDEASHFPTNPAVKGTPQGQSYTLDGKTGEGARFAAAVVARRGGILPTGTAPVTGDVTETAAGIMMPRMRRLTAVGRDLTRLTDGRAVLARITAGARELLEAPAAVTVLATDGGDLQLCRSRGEDPPEHFEGEPGPLDERIVARVRSELGGEALSVPIADGAQIRGLLAVARTDGQDGGEPAADDVWLLDALADHAAVALRSCDAALRQGEAVRSAAERSLAEAESRERGMSRIAHDLRTPLLTFRLGCDLVEEAGDDAEKVRDLLREMRLASEHLEVVAENLLQVGRMSAGLIALDPHPLDLGEIVEAAAGVVRLTAEGRGQSLVLELESGLTAYADASRLRQALVNLLGNAVKFSPEGGRVLVRGEVAGDSQVRVDVQDEGPGVPLDQLEAIFQPYYRVEETSKVYGSGLGLAIARDLVRRMDGDVVVRPADGGGATFTVTLPRRAPGFPG